MAGPRLSLLLTLLLSFALGSAGLEANNTRERIVNGFPCARGHQPWQVALFHGDEFQCSGVLVSKFWVLTVAHCHTSEYLVHMGSEILFDVNREVIKATASFIHPRYNSVTFAHDIMLVKLSHPAPLSPALSIAYVPSSCAHAGARCTVSGWGLTYYKAATNPSVLMCSNVNIMSAHDCSNFFDIGRGNHAICAAPPDENSQTCKGDSGGPLVCNGMLQGLVSFGFFPCVPKFEPVLFTRVCKYRKWIYETIRANS